MFKELVDLCPLKIYIHISLRFLFSCLFRIECCLFKKFSVLSLSFNLIKIGDEKMEIYNMIYYYIFNIDLFLRDDISIKNEAPLMRFFLILISVNLFNLIKFFFVIKCNKIPLFS